jgi:hypothetical protein
MIHPAAPTSSNNTQPPTPDSLAPGASTAAAAFRTEVASTAADTEIEDSPARQLSSSSSGDGPALSSSGSIDSVGMNNRGLLEGKTQLAVIFLVDSSGSVGDGK